MKKFLFVANFFDTTPSGANANCHAHYDALRKLFVGGGVIASTMSRRAKKYPATNKISIRCAKTRFDSLVGIFTGKNVGFGVITNSRVSNEILELIKNGDYGLVWFDDGCYGSIVKKIKQLYPGLPVYVFHHGVRQINLLQSVMEIVRADGVSAIIRNMQRMNFANQQKISAVHADVNVMFNERDSVAFTELYGQKSSKLVLPVSFIDNAHIEPKEKKPEEFNMLFVGGGGHMPNVHGIKWFAKNVMPGLNARANLIIAGNGMDMHKDVPEFRDSRISITGRVESLDPYYNAADLIVCPIFLGAGMMTKVAEAMMYGKNILATSHALNGYPDIEAQSKCDTAEEFITRINAMIKNGVERFNPANRKIFEEKYSIEAMTRILREDFMKRGII